MRPTMGTALLLATACASASSAPTPSPSSAPAPNGSSGRVSVSPTVAQTVDLATKDGRLLVAGVEIHQSTDEFRGARVGAPAARLWATLPAVYDQLGLTVNGLDTDKRAIAAVNLRAQTQLAKVRLSQYVDCGGAGTIGGRAADSYALTMNVATQVVPAGDGASTVLTLVQTFGRPAQSSGQAIHCTSTGNLEAKIAALAAEHVAP